MTRRFRRRPGLLAALLAVIFSLGAVTASYACSRDAGTVAVSAPPVDDDCAEHTMAGSCAQSCLAICHALVPVGFPLERLSFTPEARIGMEMGFLNGLTDGPEPPPPRTS